MDHSAEAQQEVQHAMDADEWMVRTLLAIDSDVARQYAEAFDRDMAARLAIPPTPTNRADAARAVMRSIDRFGNTVYHSPEPDLTKPYYGLCLHCDALLAEHDRDELCVDCYVPKTTVDHIDRALRLIKETRPVRLPWYVNLAFWIAEHTGAI